ncbi:MAG: hypothetical protein ACYC1D_16165 [Acidimicrobiales bacterium]
MNDAGYLADHGLPFNRKERYFTGTVFPLLVASSGFGQLSQLFDMCGLGNEAIGDRVQFFTEYGFVESLYDKAIDRFPNPPTGKNTPDIVIYTDVPRPRLLALEAKMYHRPTRVALVEQLTEQRTLLHYIAGKLMVSDADLGHVALLPEKLRSAIPDLGWPVVTWEQLLSAYGNLAPSHWVDVLQLALDRYERLLSPPSVFGCNATSHLSGAEIVQRFDDGVLDITYVGRAGGRFGKRLAADAVLGLWHGHRYECCDSHNPINSNWMTVAAFVDIVRPSKMPPSATSFAREPPDT